MSGGGGSCSTGGKIGSTFVGRELGWVGSISQDCGEPVGAGGSRSGALWVPGSGIPSPTVGVSVSLVLASVSLVLVSGAGLFAFSEGVLGGWNNLITISSAALVRAVFLSLASPVVIRPSIFNWHLNVL